MAGHLQPDERLWRRGDRRNNGTISISYFQHSLTLIDVNHADEDELSAVLGVDEKTAIAIVQRRTDRRFQTAADLEAVPGVDKARVESIAPRLLFDPPPEDQ